MAFDKKGFQRAAIGGAIGAAAGGIRSIYHYATGDAAAAVEAAGYFNGIPDAPLKVGDIIVAALGIGGTPQSKVYGVTTGGAAPAIKPLNVGLTATANLNFPSTAAAGQQELTIAVPGAAVGDPVAVAAPATLEAGIVITARVTAADTVTLRASNITAGSIDPAAANYTVTVFKQ